VHRENISMKQKWLCASTFLPWSRLLAPSANVCLGK